MATKLKPIVVAPAVTWVGLAIVTVLLVLFVDPRLRRESAPLIMVGVLVPLRVLLFVLIPVVVPLPVTVL